MSCIAPFAFDIFYFELLTPLLAGAQCRLVANRELIGCELRGRRVGKGDVHTSRPCADETDSQFTENRSRAPYEQIRHVFTGGEAIAPDLLREMQRAFPSAQLNVLYGRPRPPLSVVTIG
jgi:non-ribosomal peptide synthetase component F